MVYSQTDDLEFANLVAKGRESYLNLAPGEKIAVGHYLEQVCIANESLLVYAHSTTHESNENLELFRRHIRFHLGFRGAREWFDEFEQLRGFPAPYMRAIHEAIDASAAAAFGTMHCARSE